MASADPYKFLARPYALIERLVFGNQLNQARRALLYRITEGAKVLVLGGGNGKFLSYMPPSKICFIDSSASMISLARKVQTIAEVEFICMPFESYSSDSNFTHIYCPFFLDLFEIEKCREILIKIKSHLSTNAELLVVDFELNPQTSTRYQRTLVRTMYAFFARATGLRTRTLPPWEKLFSELGFDLRLKQDWQNGLVFASMWVIKSQ
jgi:ubiquinone/menaquinone biosynthesis C-methylase UbiE